MEGTRRERKSLLSLLLCSDRGGMCSPEQGCSELLCDFAVLWEVTVCAYTGAQLPRSPALPLFQLSLLASSFCHQFSNNCHRHSLHVRGPFFTTHTSYQHAEVFFLTITGWEFTLEI